MESSAPGVFRTTLTEDWYQGRGVYGGFQAALLLRAARLHSGTDLPARSMAVSFTAAATTGEAQIRVRTLHRGRTVLQLAADLLSGERTLAAALVTLGRSRRSTVGFDELTPPEVRPPEDVPLGPESLLIPEFCRHIEFRLALGSEPFEQAAAGDQPSPAELGGWCRFHDRETPLDECALAALVDAWPPAALVRATQWTGAASLDLSMQFLADPPYPDEGSGYVLYRARSRHTAGGYSEEQGDLFSRSGVPLVTLRQSIALFG